MTLPILLGLPLLFALSVAEESGPAPIREQFHTLLLAGDEPGISELFRNRPFEVIYLLEDDLRAWAEHSQQGRLEGQQERDEISAQLRNALLVAGHADRALGGDSFTRYAGIWKNWSVAERKIYKSSREALGRGRELQRDRQYDPAREAYEESLSVATRLDDLLGIARAEQALGDLAVGRKELDDAVRRHRRSRDLFQSLHHPGWLRSSHALGVIHANRKQFEEARFNLEQMVEAARSSGRKIQTASVMRLLIDVCREGGDEAAAERYQQALDTSAAGNRTADEDN